MQQQQKKNPFKSTDTCQISLTFEKWFFGS